MRLKPRVLVIWQTPSVLKGTYWLKVERFLATFSWKVSHLRYDTKESIWQNSGTFRFLPIFLLMNNERCNDLEITPKYFDFHNHH